MKKLLMPLFLASAIALSTRAAAASSAPPLLTQFAPPSHTNYLLSDRVVASAQAVPVNESQMSVPISAPVKEVLVKEGDLVTAGQVLITLYSPDLELSVKSAQLELKAAELDLDYWMPRFDRPPERREQARAEVEQARTKLATAEARLLQTSLTAPFDATIAEIQVHAGELAQSGQVVIRLGDLAHMQIQTTDLSERDVPHVQVGQRVRIYVEALHATATGKVIRVSPISDTVGGDVVFPVTIDLDEQPDGLLWGMTAEVEINTAQ